MTTTREKINMCNTMIVALNKRATRCVIERDTITYRRVVRALKIVVMRRMRYMMRQHAIDARDAHAHA